MRYPVESCYVGVDVSKERLDVAFRPASRHCFFPNDPSGIDDLVHCLLQERPALVVLEASGGYERPAAAGGLAAGGLPVAVVNPRQARDFAKATGRLAKTDALDADSLARFAEAVRPQPRYCRMRRPCSSGRSLTAEGSSLACSSLRTTASVQPLPSW